MASSREAGLVGLDGYVHAVKPSLRGAVAVCGAGRITQTISGRFSRDDERSCPACLRHLQFDDTTPG